MVNISIEDLAVILACANETAYPPRDRLEIFTYWQGKSDSVRVAYKLRAKRLLAAWGV